VRLRMIFAESWRSLSANVSTTVAATLTVLIGMFLLGLLLALGSWVRSWTNHVKGELVVKVFFADTAGPNEWNKAGRFVQNGSGVTIKRIKFVSKDDALTSMKKKYPDLTKDLAYNPLPNTLEVTPAKAEDTPLIAEKIQTAHLAGVDKVKYGQKTAHRILSVARVIEWVFGAAVLILLSASTLLIANTIRLSIFSRRREIEVMKLVGATNWFVRGPFMLEGLLCGVAGAIAAVFLLILGKELALPAILGRINSGSDVHAWPFPMVALFLIGAGLFLGAAGSGLTIRRFLRV
jgi:cell division transport system permease protein